MTGTGRPEPKPEKTPAEIYAELTPRLREVVDLLLTGMSNKEIAYRTDLTESTVKVHLKSLALRFRVKGRGALMALLLTRTDVETDRKRITELTDRVAVLEATLVRVRAANSLEEAWKAVLAVQAA